MFDAIRPRKTELIKTSQTMAKLERRMRTFTADLQRRCADYEPAPSPSYVRTNMLKKSWSRKTAWQNGVLVGEVISSGQVAPYNKFVRGRRNQQATRMAARGWQSIDDIMDDEWPKAEADFKRIFREAGR